MASAKESVNIVQHKREITLEKIQQSFLNVLEFNEKGRSEKYSTTMDFISPASTDFFLPAPEDYMQLEPQLFSLEEGEMQPIISPLMVPGIYRKIDTSTGTKTIGLTPSNVYLTESEPHGRIVSSRDFQKLYVRKGSLEDAFNNNGQPLRVLPVENVSTIGKERIKAKQKTKRSEDALTKNWDALSRLAYNILKHSSSEHSVVINRSHNEIIRTENGSKQKTLYKFLDKESLGVIPPPAQQKDNEDQTLRKIKLGRPRKPKNDNGDSDVSQTTPKVKTAKPPSQTIKNDQNSGFHVEPEKTKICSRFGRVLKPIKCLPSTVVKKPNEIPVYDNGDLINDINDKDFKCNLRSQETSDNNPCTPSSKEEEIATVPEAANIPSKRRVPPESICPTCKKIFLGRRLKRHFVEHPDHMKPDPPNNSDSVSKTSNEELSLFRFLVAKLQKSSLNEDQRADLFLHELNDLVEQLQLRSSRLIRNTFGLHLINSRTARILGIPEGQYALDMSAIDATPEPETSCPMNFDVSNLAVPSNNTRSLDYTALSLDDTLTDEAAQKLNLSAGGKLLPPSEESLLRAVDDLVPQSSITKLVVSSNLINQSVGGTSAVTSSSNTTKDIVPHIDHASDNAVEAVEAMKECSTGQQAQPMLDLAVDFFQFNTSN